MQGFERLHLRSAAGAACGGTRDGGLDRGNNFGLFWGDIPAVKDRKDKPERF